MKKEDNYNDDLDYLAELGFEKVATDASDLKDLKKRIKKSTFSAKDIYLMLGSLVVGILIGFALFFGFSKRDKNMATSLEKEDKALKGIAQGSPEKFVLLDTIFVSKENFIKPTHTKEQVSHSIKTEEPVAKDSVEMIVSKPVDLSLLNPKELKEEKLKYMINAPVFYLHDMKITNYTTLYFKKNRFVRFSGLSAAYSATNESAPAGSTLKQSADYFLHDEMANAMLQFKKGKYDEALYTLRTVSSYNSHDLNCDFYMAMSYYYKKNFSKAIPLFDECIFNANNTFLQEAMYYKALSLFESGNKEEAKKLFEKIAEEGEFYAIKAKSYLKD